MTVRLWRFSVQLSLTFVALAWLLGHIPQTGKDETRVHLTGPCKGAPYGLSIVVPAQAGPFDLVTVVTRPGDANIGGARVALPSSTILDQSNIGTTCIRAQMAERNCPAKSVVGYAKAWSPVFKRPIEGPVYLAANGGARPLPDLLAILDGEVRIVLQGEVTTLRTAGKARLQITFRVVPDAPVTRFELTMRGGKNTGLLVNNTDLCRTSERGVAVFQGQNGRTSRSSLRLVPSFKGCGKVRRQAARRIAKRKAQAQKVARKASTHRG